jgi:hypothetical protein
MAENDVSMQVFVLLHDWQLSDIITDDGVQLWYPPVDHIYDEEFLQGEGTERDTIGCSLKQAYDFIQKYYYGK